MAAKSTVTKKRADGVVQRYHVVQADVPTATEELPRPKASTVEEYDKKIKYWNRILGKANRRRKLWGEDGWNRHHLAMGVTGALTGTFAVNTGMFAHGMGVGAVFIGPLAAVAAGASAYHFARTRIPARIASRELEVLHTERDDLAKETMTKKQIELEAAESELAAAHARFKKAQAAADRASRNKPRPPVVTE
jgi:hypothetical protein